MGSEPYASQEERRHGAAARGWKTRKGRQTPNRDVTDFVYSVRAVGTGFTRALRIVSNKLTGGFAFGDGLNDFARSRRGDKIADRVTRREIIPILARSRVRAITA